MDESLMAIALLALSTVLIIAEVFVPSGGLLAVGMFVSLIASVYYAYVAWWDTSPGFFFGFLGFSVVFLPGVVVASFAALPHTPFGKRILLSGPSQQDVVPFSKEEEQMKSYLGRIVTADTPLTPNGFVMIDYERINASSEGVIIDRGQPVKVIKAVGTRLIVREVDEDEQAKAQQKPAEEPEELAEADSDADQSPLDFDLPQS